MYITENEVRFLCNKIGSSQLPLEEVVIFIEKAEARIDAKLATRYRLPLPSPPPPLVKSIAADFAASFIIDKYYGDIARSNEQTPLADVYFKRAEKDLSEIVEKGLLDRLSGIIVVNSPEEVKASPCMRTNKRGKSDMERALSKW